MAPAPKTIAFYRRPGHQPSLRWENRLRSWLREHYPEVRLVSRGADVVFVLGGDGTIMEAARKSIGRTLVGLNLGTVGFMAAVRSERRFLGGVRSVMEGGYHARPRLMLEFTVRRSARTVFCGYALNEVYVQNPLGMVTIDVRIGRTRIQRIMGTGALVASPTGSTGYNLSAHGPIVDPSLDLFIVSEILDHNTPTPSIIIPPDRTVTLSVLSFRPRGTLRLGRHPADVVLSADGAVAFPLAKGDLVRVSRAARSVAIAQLKADYFYESLHEKFSIT